jgi:hypothetical protein
MRITIELPADSAPTKAEWPENPYKGLSFYTPDDVALFGGREAEVKACSRVVGRERTKVLLLLGPTGCGKSSFLRAGLIPYLESEVERFQFLQIYDINKVKAMFIRCTEAPLTRLCERLYDWGETPFLIHLPDADSEEVSMGEIREGKDRNTFIKESASSVPKLIEILRAVVKRLPKTLVLVIDQGEEALTLNDRGDESNKRLFFDFLIAFSETTIDLKIIVALRKEYFSEFHEELTQRRFSEEHVGVFHLEALSTQQMVEAIRFPTSRDIPLKYLQGRPQPGDYYNFDFEAGLPEKIVKDLRSVKKAEGGMLPVLQITCERLYTQADNRRNKSLLSTTHCSVVDEVKRRVVVAHSDYESLGDLDEQVDRYVEEKILAEIDCQLPDFSVDQRGEELTLWKDVLYTLVKFGPDNTALSSICSKEQLRRIAAKKRCQASFEKMIQSLSDDKNRILRQDTRQEEEEDGRGIVLEIPSATEDRRYALSQDSGKHYYYSLGHDAIAVALSKWGATRKLIFERRQDAKRFPRADLTPRVLDPATMKSVSRFVECDPAVRELVEQAYRLRTEALEIGTDSLQADAFKRAAGAFQAAFDAFKERGQGRLNQLGDVLREEFAFCCIFTGDEKLRNQAEKIYRELRELWPDRISILIRLAQLRRDAGALIEAFELLEAGLAAEKAKPELDPEVARQTSWLLRRNLAFICWRLVDLDPARADVVSLLRRAIELSDEALTYAQTDSQNLSARLNLLYYLVGLWQKLPADQKHDLAARGAELLEYVRPKIDLNQWPVADLDSVERAEVAFGSRARAQAAARVIVQRLAAHLNQIRNERGCSHGVAFEALSRDEKEAYLFAQEVALGLGPGEP